MLLTIAIPTWCRALKVAQRLEELAPQLVPGVEIRVFENGGTEETANAVRPFLGTSIHYLPSTRNDGAAANILRCAREGDSDWLWILGDDDRVKPDTVSRILLLCRASEAIAVTTRPFARGCGRVSPARDVEELFRLTSLAEALFISATVWRRSLFSSATDVFMDGSYSMGPHLCVMLRQLERGLGQVAVSDEALTIHESGKQRWSRLEFLRRCTAMLDICQDQAARRAVANALWPTWQWAAQDSLAEAADRDCLGEWRHAVWSGLLRFAQYRGPGQATKTLMLGLRARLKPYLRRPMHAATDWTAFALPILTLKECDYRALKGKWERTKT